MYRGGWYKCQYYTLCHNFVSTWLLFLMSVFRRIDLPLEYLITTLFFRGVISLCAPRQIVASVWCNWSAIPTLSLATYRICCGAIMSGPVEHHHCNVLLLRHVDLRNAAVAGETWQRGRTNYVVRPREFARVVTVSGVYVSHGRSAPWALEEMNELLRLYSFRLCGSLNDASSSAESQIVLLGRMRWSGRVTTKREVRNNTEV